MAARAARLDVPDGSLGAQRRTALVRDGFLGKGSVGRSGAPLLWTSTVGQDQPSSDDLDLARKQTWHGKHTVAQSAHRTTVASVLTSPHMYIQCPCTQ